MTAQLPGEWSDHGACVGHDPEVFYPLPLPNGRVDLRPARTICAGCPVRQPCLEYAIEAREPYGIWGGLTQAERRHLTAARLTPDQRAARAALGETG